MEIGDSPSESKMAVSLSGIRAVLIDISGVLYDGQKPIPGSLEALQKYVPSWVSSAFSVLFDATLHLTVPWYKVRPISPRVSPN